MREIIVRFEIDDDMEISNFEQVLLEEGIEDLDCVYEIIEN